MRNLKIAAGTAALFALVLSAFAVSSVSAAGLRTFTCVSNGNGDLHGDHCLASGVESWHSHLSFGQNLRTTGTWDNANTAAETTAAQPAILKGTLSGVAAEIECTEVTGSGSFENKETTGGELYGHSTGVTTFKGCKMLKPAGCTIAAELTTNNLTTTTEGVQTAEAPHTVLVKPAGETSFIEITTTKCTNEGLNQTYPVSGSFKAKANAGTVTSIHSDVTAQNTLKFGGQKAGLSGALTMTGHGSGSEQTHTLVYTT